MIQMKGLSRRYTKRHEKLSAPPTKEKKTATTINDIPGEILSMIFNELVLQANQNTEPDPFETFNIASPSTPECRVILKARTVLRSVCKQWCECIDGDSMFWANIYINGTRIPGENEYFATKSRILGNLNPEDWLCTYRTPEQNRQLKEEAEDKLEVAAAVMSIARSKSQDINLILREPTYHLYSWRYNQVTPFRVRDGVLELIHEHLKERRITGLSITGRDIAFIRQLLDPKLEHELDKHGVWRERRYRMGYEQLIATCFSRDADLSLPRIHPLAADASKEEHDAYEALLEEIRSMNEERDALVKDLHTLRIEEPRDEDGEHRHWAADWQRCELPAAIYPSLRRVDLTVNDQLCSFALPYAQLTHLRLETWEKDTVIIGILEGCARLECLALKLLGEAQNANASVPTVVTLERLASIECITPLTKRRLQHPRQATSPQPGDPQGPLLFEGLLWPYQRDATAL
ncbi:hypothetical protein DFP72DRAFT_839510 [Ephemerocybe angulata]|uniref:F-box domain-containing protein n=1 Tax=Ephemerocybe angulata TaxID=980116 RepID=A0A8H6MHM4_9AGAR|nr:hypothetical protein DFP72DRAFT_839510 [Tulosesus angulatus]